MDAPAMPEAAGQRGCGDILDPSTSGQRRDWSSEPGFPLKNELYRPSRSPFFSKRQSLRLLATARLPMVECECRAHNRGGYCRKFILFEHQSARRPQFLVSQHRSAGWMLRQCLKLPGRETAAISRILPRADNVETGYRNRGFR